MSDEKHSTSAKTTELPALTDRALLEDLSRVVRSGLKEVNVRLEDVVNEGIRTNTRLTRIEERVDEVEGRIGRTSHRVREVSSNDLSNHAQLASELAAEKKAREALAAVVAEQPTKKDLAAVTAAQTSTLGPVIETAVADAIKAPMFKTVAKSVGVALIAACGLAAAYCGFRTLQIQTEMAAHPAPTTTVYVVAPPDGGAK